jgi:hypothetical protein
MKDGFMIFEGMKGKYIAGAFILAILLFTACEDLLKDILTVETDYFEMDFTVQPTDLEGFQMFSEEVFDSDLDRTLEDAGIDAELLESAYLKEAEISIASEGAYTNFDILKFLELTLYHDSLGEKKIAYLNPVPPGQSTINLELTSDDLLTYFYLDTFVLTAQGFLLERVYEEVDLHARVKFEITGGI